MSAGKGGIDMETGGLTVRGRVAEAFDLAATLHVRHLARGTSLTLKSLLAALDQNGPERLSTLATVTMVTQPVVSQLVGRLEREGLVIRRIDPTDARAMLVEITDAGRKLRGELRQSQHERMAEVLDTLTPENELTLSQAMCAALPVLEHLSRGTVPDRRAGRAVTALTG
jgi:DNA-binding MarR family transcriptional regulator